MSDPKEKIRLDKWLWQARFFKTRTLSAKVITGGHVRINATRVSKPATPVTIGDTLTFPQAKDVRIVEIQALGTRRGPAPEAQALYTDHTPVREKEYVPPNPKFDGKGRPSKHDRRAQKSFEAE